ncbi:peroxidase 12-like [Typha angustifolia]|uniref:peroxidase 12-like n=1 Tax=Typha angustifolia TaxID=59011 RepID=UPI003C307F5E
MALITRLFLLLLSSLALFSSLSEAGVSQPPLAEGLSWNFYDETCPELKDIIRSNILDVLSNDIGIAAGLLRIHFHDCFVQGCDASVLLSGTTSEQVAPPNLTLRPEALQVINDLRDLVESACGLVVSCADITTLATRDAVYLSGGPYYDVPLGRRDSLTFASASVIGPNLPSPRANVTTLINVFSSKNLSVADLVALSGAHTIGRGHCSGFTNRLPPNVDPTIDPAFADQLVATCPNASVPNTVPLDVRTPDFFDNKYYVNLVNRQGLFTSDEGLFFDDRTQQLVSSFAAKKSMFFNHFAKAMVKMSQLEVLTGTAGEIRKNCAVVNSDSVAVA